MFRFHERVSACVPQQHHRIRRLILLQRLNEDHPHERVAALNGRFTFRLQLSFLLGYDDDGPMGGRITDI